MTSYLWSSNTTEFETLLEKLTSENLPYSSSIDLNLSLNFSDLIRSNSISSDLITKLIIKRFKLKSNNPNILILLLNLLDISIKNGGNKFLLSIGSNDFTNILVKLVKGEPINEGGITNNLELIELSTKKLQDWALAFKSIKNLENLPLVNSYFNLKLNSYIKFPPIDNLVTAAFIDSLSAPEWTDSPYCTRCRTQFSTFNRKHHCRNCGSVFDQTCSSTSVPLPHYGILQPVRVCDGCIKKIKEGAPTSGLVRSVSLGNGSSSSREFNSGRVERSNTGGYGSNSRNHRSSNSTSAIKSSSSSSSRSKEEEDFQKAIAASLADSNSSPDPSSRSFSSSNKPTYSSSYSQSTTTNNNNKKEEEDPELAAAIAASLRDITPIASAPSETYASLYPSSSSSQYNNYNNNQPSYTTSPYPTPTQTSYHTLNTYDLTPHEQSSLSTFSTLPSLTTSPYSNQNQNQQPQIIGIKEQNLYQQITNTIQPKLERGLEDTERRKEILVEMNRKLGEATRLYEGLLDERIRVGGNRIGAYPQQPQYNQPPPAQSQQQYQYQQPQPQPQYEYASPSPQQQQTYYSSAPPQSQLAPQPPPQSFTYLTQNYPLPSPTSQSVPNPEPQPPQQQPYAPPPPPPLAQQQQQQQQIQQPTGYYKSSSFPSVPQNELPTLIQGAGSMLFPSVPVVNPWDLNANGNGAGREGEGRQGRQGEEEKAKVGELIEL